MSVEQVVHFKVSGAARARRCDVDAEVRSLMELCSGGVLLGVVTADDDGESSGLDEVADEASVDLRR